MKTLTVLAVALLPLAAQTSSSALTYPQVVTPYQVITAGPHDRVWQSVTIDAPGVTNNHTYTEVATALNFWNGAAWVPTIEAFQITASGYAVATNGQHKVIVGPDLTVPGAIDFLGPDGLRLVSNPVGLAYRDASSGQSALIASVTNSQGELTASNVVTFPQAFNGAGAALAYTYTRAGLAQDVVLYKQLPTPDTLGLSPSSTILEIWTEFLNPPQPAVTASATTADQTLDFGQTRMARGFAYLLNSGGLQRVPLHKTWTNILNRYFLIESIPYPTLKPLLDTLQASAAPAPKTQTAKRVFPDRKTLVASVFQPKPKPVQTAAIRPGRPSRQPAVVLDYQTLSTSQNTYDFAADTTYYVSSLVNISGTATFEGGTVIKLAPGSSAGICLLGSVVWGGSAYRPIVVSGKDDNSLGDPISGSSGNPNGNYYGACALELYTAANPAFLRISYATEAIQLNEDIPYSLSHAQIENCSYVADNESRPVSFTLHNVLLYSNLNLSTGVTPIGWSGEQVTADLVTNTYGDSTTFTNSLFAGTTGFSSGGTANAWISPDTGVFQTVGAGAHYLAGNTYRGQGTANLAPSTLAYLAQRTTWPPTPITTISGNTTLSTNPTVPRDVGPNPDLGYHL